MGHVIEPPDPNDHLYERIFSSSNVKSAWKRVKSNKGAAGVDGVSIEAFPGLFRDQWENIRKSLLRGCNKIT
jgi:RNA-directed DNA polymerase